MTHEDEQAISLKLFVVFSKAYKFVLEQAFNDMRKHGLSPSEFMTLEVLYTKGKVPLQQIGDKILVTSGSITYNIDKLENKGLLRRIPSQEDRRVIHAELTEEGKALFDHIFPIHAAKIQHVMNALTIDEQLIATEWLKRIGKRAEEVEA